MKACVFARSTLLLLLLLLRRRRRLLVVMVLFFTSNCCRCSCRCFDQGAYGLLFMIHMP